MNSTQNLFCSHCGSKLGAQSICDVCGHRPLDSVPATPGPIQETDILSAGFFNKIRTILTRPHTFFENLSPRGGMSGPLAFMLILHWIASAIEYLWRNMSQNIGFQYLEKFLSQTGGIDRLGRETFLDQTRHALQNWFLGTWTVVMDPFLTLAWLLISGAIVYIGARILAKPTSKIPTGPTYESVIRVLCYASTPTLARCIPFVGGLVSWIAIFYFSVIGFEKMYQIRPGRATLIALFPSLIALAFSFVLFLVLVLGIFGIMKATSF